jgi:NADH dehydrogenase (ubiquinone) 1 alpha/beta subcomplex 1
MLSHLLRTSVRLTRAQPRLLTSSGSILRQPLRTYYPNGQLMKRDEGDYFADPIEVAERIVRLIALHDNVKNPSAVTLQSEFSSIGFNVLDMQELFLQAEREFDVEISEDDCESFHTVNDLVENIARNFYTKM